MVLVLTQLTKGIGILKKIPTQLWSYLLALLVLLPGLYFTGGLTLESVALALLNAAIVSLAANGGYEAAARIAGKGKE